MRTEDLLMGMGILLITSQYIREKGMNDLLPVLATEKEVSPVQTPLYAVISLDKTGIYQGTKVVPSYPDGNGSGLITTLYRDNLAGKFSGKKENQMLEVQTQIGGQDYRYFIHESAVNMLTYDEFSQFPVLDKTEQQLIEIRNNAFAL